MVGAMVLGGLVVGGVGGLAPGHGAVVAPPGPERAAERAENYVERKVGGFTVHVHKDLLGDKELTRRVMLHLEADLDEIAHMVPAPAFKLLSEVEIWVEKQGMSATANKGHGLCCHWSPVWLKNNGVLAEKVGGVEIVNSGDFLAWRRDQPYMLFHELAHALHWRLAKLDGEIDAAYGQAMRDKRYDAVGRNTVAGGKTVRAYAASNSHEYFAELSEAYFAVNDFYPYTRAQLQAHDPAGMAMVAKVWSLNAEQLGAGRGERR